MPGTEFVYYSSGNSNSSSSSGYFRLLDPSLLNNAENKKLTEKLKLQKKMMVELLNNYIDHYKNAKDKYENLMYYLKSTIVVPLTYYFYRKYIVDNLPTNRQEHCSFLIEIVQSLGTEDIRGKIYIEYNLKNLFIIFEMGKSIKLMETLLAIYGSYRKLEYSTIDKIDNYKKAHNFEEDFDIEKYFKKHKINLLMGLHDVVGKESSVLKSSKNIIFDRNVLREVFQFSGNQPKMNRPISDNNEAEEEVEVTFSIKGSTQSPSAN